MPAASRPPVVDYDLDNGLRRRKKRQRQQSELCGDGLPSSQKQREHEQPRRKPLETVEENSKTNAGKGRQGKEQRPMLRRQRRGCRCRPNRFRSYPARTR